MSSNNKMKGLLKGLRYISEIFENEKEPEMEIGMPTDVKHVAHIGVDGPAAAVKSAPSWMNEFKSAAVANNGEVREEDPVKATDMQQEVPKSTSSSRNGKEESKVKGKSDKSKQSKKGSKSSSSKETSESTTKHKKKSKDPNQATDSKSEDPKKSSRQKKSKESADGSSRRSRNLDFDNGSESGSLTSKASGFEEEP